MYRSRRTINYCLFQTSYSRHNRYDTYLHILLRDIWCLWGIEYHSCPNNIPALIHACTLVPPMSSRLNIISKPQSQLLNYYTCMRVRTHTYTYTQLSASRIRRKCIYNWLFLGFLYRSSSYKIVVSAKWPSRIMFVIPYRGTASLIKCNIAQPLLVNTFAGKTTSSAIKSESSFVNQKLQNGE